MTKFVLPAKQESHNRWRPAGHPNGRHAGEDFGWGSGYQIFAAASGTVVSVYDNDGYNQGWGNRVRIKHGEGVYTTYNHFAPNTITVKEGQKVNAGHLLGFQGSTGKVNAPHLHWELEIGGMGAGFRVDPRPYFTKDLPGTPTTIVGKPTTGERPLKLNQRVVRKLGSKAWLNGRASASVKGAVQQRLEPGTVGNFDAWRYGDKVTIDGVTSNIWFRGAFKKKWFAAAGFTSQKVTGLKQVKPVIIKKPVATRKNYVKTPKKDILYYYKSYTNALNGNYSKTQFLPSGGKAYEVLENPKTGPVRIRTESGSVWVGTRNNPAKIVRK